MTPRGPAVQQLTPRGWKKEEKRAPLGNKEIKVGESCRVVENEARLHCHGGSAVLRPAGGGRARVVPPNRDRAKAIPADEPGEHGAQP